MNQSQLQETFRANFLKYKPLIKSANAGNAYYRKFADTKIEVYPNITSDDPEFVEFLVQLREELKTKFPKTETRNGVFVSSPIASDFSKLLTKAGSVRPLSFPQFDDGHGKVMPEDMKECLSLVMRLRYRNFDMSKPGSLANKSSSGFPMFSYELEYKKAHLTYILNNADKFETAARTLDLDAFNDLGIMLINNTQIRRQADKWIDGAPKRRKFSSFTDAHCGKERYYQDEVLLYEKDRRLATCRTRVVRAFAGPINYLFTAAVAPLRNWGDSYYGFTYKHKDASSILKKFEKFKYFRGLDVTQFDNSVSADILDNWAENFPFKYRELVKLMFRAPTIDSNSELANGFCMNKSDFRYTSGLPSGIFCTSMMGKDIMSSVILAGLFRVIGKQDEVSVDKILRGESDYGFVNMGDDTVIMTNNEQLLDAWFQATQDVFFTLEAEDGITFLGNMLYQSKDGLRLCNSLESYFEKAYVPERSIKSKLRPYPILGLLERRNVYKSHPLFNEARSIEKDLFRYYFRQDQGVLESENLVKPDLSGEVLSDADIDVLANIDKIFYKYDVSDINPKISSMFVSTISQIDTSNAMHILLDI